MASVTRSIVSNLLRSRMLMSGPIPVSDYMKIALTSQLMPKTHNSNDNSERFTSVQNMNSGYYMKSDVFGQHGDFTTSPEITQLFGEILAIWGLQTWMQIGGPKKFSIVELGPGRGTLSKDMLRVFKQFEKITGSNVSLHLVEISPYLATVQCETLTSTKDMIKDTRLIDPGTEFEGQTYYHHASSQFGYPVYWYRDVKDVPRDFHFYVAHEFLDALPIHKLQKVGNEWREVLIDIDPEQDSCFRFVVSRNETPVIKVLKLNYPEVLQDSRQHLEVSIEGLGILGTITDQMNACGGIASFIDYGHDGTKTDTFRAFYKHKLHDPLKDPGTVDLTADVDFSTIKKLFNDKVLICGPQTQRNFLQGAGIEQRLQMLLSTCKNPKDKENLLSGYKMIMNDMGESFKIMTFLPNVLKSCMPNIQIVGY